MNIMILIVHMATVTMKSVTAEGVLQMMLTVKATSAFTSITIDVNSILLKGIAERSTIAFLLWLEVFHL